MEKYQQSLEDEKMLQEEEEDEFQSSIEFLNLLEETDEMERKIARGCQISFSMLEFERKHPRYFTLALAGGPVCHPSDYDSNFAI